MRRVPFLTIQPNCGRQWMLESIRPQMRASEIARRRTEEEGAEAFFLCERRRRRRILDVRATDLQEEMAEQRLSVPTAPMKTAATQRTSLRAERAIKQSAMREQLQTKMITTRPRCQTPMCMNAQQATQWRAPAGRSAGRNFSPGRHVLGMQIPISGNEGTWQAQRSNQM
jgi:hypothetical protein